MTSTPPTRDEIQLLAKKLEAHRAAAEQYARMLETAKKQRKEVNRHP